MNNEIQVSEFPVYQTAVTNEFLSQDHVKDNRKQWDSVLEKHQDLLNYCVEEGTPKYMQRHVSRGMLLGKFKF